MTTIRDASLSTSRRRQLALYTFRGQNVPPRPEQVGGPTSAVPLAVYVGAQLIGQQTGGSCACTSAVTLQGFSR